MRLQGVMILAAAPDSALAYKRRAFYQNAMRGIVLNWSNCSNKGEASFKGSKDPFCKCVPPTPYKSYQLMYMPMDSCRGRNKKGSGLLLVYLPSGPSHVCVLAMNFQTDIGEPVGQVLSAVSTCRRTPDGSAYPLDMPWGNMGTTMNGVCAAALYNYYGFDEFNSTTMADSRCFMQRQLGYIFNHKCPEDTKSSNSSCNTPDAEGFSYMVGCAFA